MKRYTTITVALLASAVLAGCSSGSSDSPSADVKFTLNTATPTGELDTLTWGITGDEPASLDWIYDWDYGPANTVQANLCEGLMRQNPDGTTTPALASAVAQPDDTTYVYTLRDGVTFTDGKPMTAADVVFSLERNVTAKPASYWGLWYGNVKSIEATGDNEVTVKLRTPDALFGSVMSTPAGYVGEKAYIEKAGSTYGTAAGGVMCTGPFKLASWDKGQSITLERNDGYWDKDLMAKSKEVVFSFISDSAAMTSALKTGEIDGASGMDVSTLKALSSADNGHLYFNEGSEVVTMQFNDLTTGPLADVKIRQALRDSIDYDGIVAGILDGFGAPAKASATPSTFGYASDVWQAGYDALAGGEQNLDEAKKLIEEAGGAPSEPIVIAVASSDQTTATTATAIQDSAKEVGLNVEVRKYPQNEFTNLFYDPTARKDVNVMMNVVTPDTPDPLELMIQVIPGSPYNFTGLKDPELASTLMQARQTTDDTKRAELGVKAMKHLNDNVIGLPIYSLNARTFLNDDVTGVPVATLSQWYYPWAATVGKS